MRHLFSRGLVRCVPLLLAAAFALSIGAGSLFAAGGEAPPAPVGGDAPALYVDGQPLYAVTEAAIGPGVRHGTFTTRGDGPAQRIHVVRVDRGEPSVFLTASLGRDRVEGAESVLGQARRRHGSGGAVVAGVNADFFVAAPISGQPVGLHVEEGGVVVSPNGRPVFALDADGRPFIGAAALQGELWRERPPADGASAERGAAHPLDDDLFYRAAVDEVNRPLTRLELVLYTPRLGPDTPPVDGGFVTVRGVSGPLLPGVTYTGVVVPTDAVDGPGGRRAAIPEDGVVFAARGRGQVLLDELTPGEWVHFRLDLAAPSSPPFTAVAGGPILLADGESVPLDDADPLVAAAHPRTAVGFNDDEIFLVTVDGRRPGHSEGLTLHALAELMRALGATDALNLDGGGSTTMLVRPPGAFEPEVVNQPSDGHDRAVANALLVVADVKPGPLARLLPAPASPPVGGGAGDPVPVLQGARVPLTARGQDGRHSPVEVPQDEVVWRVEGDAGYIDVVDGSGPFFVAAAPGIAEVHARSGPARGAFTVEVVDGVAAVALVPDVLSVAAGETAALRPAATDGAGRPVWVDGERLQWRVVAEHPQAAEGADGPGGGRTATVPVASVDAGGRVTGLRAGEATVEGALPGRGAEDLVVGGARIVVDRAPAPVGTFADRDLWFGNAVRSRVHLDFGPPPVAGPLGGDLRSGTDLPFEGDPAAVAARLQYDFRVAEGATAAAYVQAASPIPLPDRPTGLGVWVHAEGNEHWLRAHVLDGQGERHVVDFTAVGGIDWTGWRYVTAPLPAEAPLPVAFERIYATEIHRHRQTPGVLYFYGLEALYGTPR